MKCFTVPFWGLFHVSGYCYHYIMRYFVCSIFYDNTHLTAKKGICIMALTPGMTGEATTIVVHENTAAAVGAGGVEVFGTPMMVALMENAAWRAVAAHLDEGYVTVGTLVNIRHLAATPVGQKVRAVAELIEID